VSDDGVDEMFALGSQLVDALVGREVLELDGLGGGFTLGFEAGEHGVAICSSIAPWICFHV